MKRVFKIDSERANFHAFRAVQDLPSDKVWQVTIEPETRTLAGNRAQWPILSAFADQLLWPVNGVMTKLTADDWKTILTSAYRQEMARVTQGIDGNIVMLGHRTREFKREEWGEWMEFLHSVAADRDVKIPMSKGEAARCE